MAPASQSRWTRLLPLIGLFVVSLVPRLLHLASIHDAPLFTHLFLDPLYYDEWGRSIAAGNWLGDRIFFQDPLYPYFLGGLYALVGHDYLIVAVVQALLGSLMAPLVFIPTRCWFGERAAWIAGALAALYAPAIYYEGLILKTWLGTVLVAAAAALLSGAIRSQRNGAWFGTGFVFALGVLARGNLLLFLPVLTAWALIDPSVVAGGKQPAGRWSWRVRLRDRAVWLAVASLALGAALPLGATALRNRIVGGEWVLTTSNAGQNLYIGNHAGNVGGRYAPPPFVDANPKHEERDFAREAERRTGRRGLGPSAVSAFWADQALGWIREHPGDWLRLTVRKFRNFVGAYEIPDNLDFYLYRESSSVLRLPLPGFGLVAPLGLLGAWLSLRRPGWPRGLLLFLVVYAASVLLFFVFSRFRMALMPAMFVFAGHAVVLLGKAFRDARTRGAARRRLTLLLAGLLVLFALVNLPVRAPADHWTMRLASMLRLPVRTETTAMAHFNLGLSYAIQAGEADDPDPLLDLAETELRRSLEQSDGQARVHVELAKVLARQDRVDEAIAAYERATGLDAREWTTHRNLGVLLRRQGRLRGAEAALAEAARLAPDSAYLHVQLGEIRLELGRPAEAAASFRRALVLDPASPRAREGLVRAGQAAADPRREIP